jgi:hypothetical protein
VWLPHACNSSYLGGWDLEDQGYRPVQANSFVKPYLQNNESKMDLRCGSKNKPTISNILKILGFSMPEEGQLPVAKSRGLERPKVNKKPFSAYCEP